MPETNYQHFFNQQGLIDTVCLLTYDSHPREECRRFKIKLKCMNSVELSKWLNEPWNPAEFNW